MIHGHRATLAVSSHHAAFLLGKWDEVAAGKA